MNVLFANPWGFLALFGLPVVLAIHLLQRTARRVETSTLFLLAHLAAESSRGRQIERLRNSLPLWLQLLAVLLSTWLLIQPRFLRHDSEQTIVAVLDSSVSVTVFREPLLTALRKTLARYENSAARTRWVLLASDPEAPTLYSGERIDDLTLAARKWQPRLGQHDPASALREALALARGGTVIYFSDHRVPVPKGVGLVAVGAPVDNVGFAGASAGAKVWKALIANPSGRPQRRDLRVNGQPRPEIELAAGEVREISGPFPADGRVQLHLSPDAFTLDDALPVVRPQPQPLALQLPPDAPDFFRRFQALIEAQGPGGERLTLVVYQPFQPVIPTGNAIVFSSEPGPPGKPVVASVVAASDELTSGLQWNGLQCRDNLEIPTREGDQPLLWAGERVLIFVRQTDAGRQLIVNFSLRDSNAERWPAFVILLHRFAEQIRAQGSAVETINAELGQRLGTDRRAPFTPGFFDLGQIKGAAHFADVREADFTSAATLTELADDPRAVSLEHRRPDPFASIWILLLGGILLANWWYTSRRITAPADYLQEAVP